MNEPNPSSSPDLDQLRTDLRGRMASLMGGVMQSYDQFGVTDVPMEAKAFAAHHAAGKAALAHLEALTKLARWAEGAGAGGGGDEVDPLADLIGEARAALAGIGEGDA